MHEQGAFILPPSQLLTALQQLQQLRQAAPLFGSLRVQGAGHERGQ